MDKKHTTIVSTIKPKVREAEINDFEQVYPLLKKINSKRLKRDDWFRLFQNHWSLEEFSPGIVLEKEDEIVGFLGTIYSRQIIDGQSHLVCNLSSWIVQDEYRSHSVMMILPLIRKKDLLLTSFSSNDTTYQLYQKLGFKEGNASRRIIYAWPFLQRKMSADYQIVTDNNDISKIIRSDKKVFADHKGFGNICVLIKYHDEECLLIGVRRKKCFKLYYSESSIFLQKHINNFKSNIMARLHVRKMIIDEHLLEQTPLFLSRKLTRGNPYQYKTRSDMHSPVLPKYSEIFLLNM